MTTASVIVLNSDCTYMSTISWKAAFRLLNRGKAEIVKLSNTVVQNCEKTFQFQIPVAVRLLKYIHSIYKREIPFTRKNLLTRDEYTCQYCGKQDDRATVDHIIPKSRGGASSWENCVAACSECNHKKADQTPSEAKMYLRKKPWQPTIHEFTQIKIKRSGFANFIKELWSDGK